MISRAFISAQLGLRPDCRLLFCKIHSQENQKKNVPIFLTLVEQMAAAVTLVILISPQLHKNIGLSPALQPNLPSTADKKWQ